MIQRIWRSENQRILICIDSYEQGNPQGRLYNSFTGDSCFHSLTQLLILTEEMLEEELIIRATSPATKRSEAVFSLISAPVSYRAFHSVRNSAKVPFSTHSATVEAVPSLPLC